MLDRLANRALRSGGIPHATARKLAITLIAALEGAFVLSRAMRNTEPLEVAGTATATAVQAALAG